MENNKGEKMLFSAKTVSMLKCFFYYALSLYTLLGAWYFIVIDENHPGMSMMYTAAFLFMIYLASKCYKEWRNPEVIKTDFDHWRKTFKIGDFVVITKYMDAVDESIFFSIGNGCELVSLQEGRWLGDFKGNPSYEGNGRWWISPEQIRHMTIEEKAIYKSEVVKLPT